MPRREARLMELRDKVAVVTGGAGGIGAALCRRFAAEGAAVAIADLNLEAAQYLAREIGGTAIACNVGIESDVQQLVAEVTARHGRIDVFCSNAGITVKGGLETPNADWQRMWDVNVMSRLYAARAVVPGMIERGGGYLLQTASAAALLTEIGSASYAATKHADLALAEWLAMQYGRSGIRVSCICPLAVATEMIDHDDPIHRYLDVSSICVEDVADSVVRGMAAEQFLILPHPDVSEYIRLKSEDFDRWIRGMQRMREKMTRQRKSA
jgi:NAD(P)-dependent dehydrogenase (short-subunit alcohol dehydrogenase family)